jgi:hypothetical protein
VELARLGPRPPVLDDRDIPELPDLDSAVNDRMTWQGLVVDLGAEHASA